MNQAQFYVLSSRDINHSVAFSCVVEFEDVVISAMEARLVTSKEFSQNISIPHSKQSTNYALIIGISFGDIITVLRHAQAYLDAFDGIYAYVFDSIIFNHELAIPAWRKTLSSYYRLARKINRLFVPFPEATTVFSEHFIIPVSYIPLAVDVLTHGSALHHKVIDVNGYGRQDVSCSELLSTHFNRIGSGRIYHHTDHMRVTAIHDVYAHRRFFWQTLRASKIALAFDALAANNNQRFTFSFVGQRWFESAAAGCVIMGRRPNCPEMNKLFFWEDSTIELPEKSEEMLLFIEETLKNTQRIQTIATRNYSYMAGYHDWRNRLFSMLEVLDIPPPELLKLQLSKLQMLHQATNSNNP